MTAGELGEHKFKMYKVMMEHLEGVGYPDISNEAVMKELKPMYVKLEEAGLILPGMNYQAYVAIANDRFLMSEVDDLLGL